MAFFIDKETPTYDRKIWIFKKKQKIELYIPKKLNKNKKEII